MYESNGTTEECYRDRNQLAVALARMAILRGWDAGVRERDEPWPIIVIDLPIGQVSYHVTHHAVPDDLQTYPGEWDGHDLATKRDRMERFITNFALLDKLERESRQAQ